MEKKKVKMPSYDPKDGVTNKQFANQDDHFKKKCAEAGITATSRQASKFRMGKGLAFKTKSESKQESAE